MPGPRLLILPLVLGLSLMTLGCAAESTPAVAPDAPSAALTSVLEDVGRVAPALEAFYRGGAYPQQLDEVIDSLDEAGLELTDGNVLNGYRYDADTVEFTLCVEAESGAFATYDTRPMSLRQSGESGGCPDL